MRYLVISVHYNTSIKARSIEITERQSMLRKIAICWLAVLALGMVASSTMSLLAAQAVNTTSTGGNTGLVIFVQAHGEISHVEASRVTTTTTNVNPSPVVGPVGTSNPNGWWGNCCT